MLRIIKLNKQIKEHLGIVNGESPLTIFIDDISKEGLGILEALSSNNNTRVIASEQNIVFPYIELKNTQDAYDIYSIIGGAQDAVVTPSAESKDKVNAYEKYISELARSCHAQIVVTEKPALLVKGSSGYQQPINFWTPVQALAYVGFLSRMRGRSGVDSVNRSMAYWVTSYDLLSVEVYKLVQALSKTNDGSDMPLRTISRVSDMLKSRDYINQQILNIELGKSGDDILYFLDHYLVSVIAAFDTLAKVTDMVYQPPTSANKRFRAKDISWTGGWSNSAVVIGLDPKTAFNRHSDLHTLINTFRNYIHAEGLKRPVLSLKDGNIENPKFYVPETKINDIYDNDGNLLSEGVNTLMTRVDPSNTWVKYRNGNGKVGAFDINDFVEQTLNLSVTALRDIISSIDVSRIEGVNVNDAKNEFDGDWPKDSTLKELRLLFGLAD